MRFYLLPKKCQKLLAVSGVIVVLLGTSACSGGQVVTLYRNSMVLPEARMHVATFNSTEKDINGTSLSYNAANCEIAAELFKSQYGVDPKIRYWCEQGAFSP